MRTNNNYTVINLMCVFIVCHFFTTNSQYMFENDYQYRTVDHNLPISVSSECSRRLVNDRMFNECRDRTYDEWMRVNKYAKQIKYMCCYYWDIFDCMEVAISRLCVMRTSMTDDFMNFKSRKDELIRYYEIYLKCNDYTYGSVKCHFPVWGIVVIVSVCITLLLVVICIAICLFRIRRVTH